MQQQKCHIPFKRTYTIIRVFRPLDKDRPIESMIYDDDEWDAMLELIRKCKASNISYDIEVVRPH